MNLPLLNREDNPESQLNIIYEHDAEKELTKVCIDGKSHIYAAIMRQKAGGRFKPLTYLVLLELRNDEMPIIEAGYPISDDPETILTPETKSGELDREALTIYFPIDEDDEENMLGIFEGIKDKLDLTKLPSVSSEPEEGDDQEGDDEDEE